MPANFTAIHIIHFLEVIVIFSTAGHNIRSATIELVFFLYTGWAQKNVNPLKSIQFFSYEREEIETKLIQNKIKSNVTYNSVNL